MNVKEAVKYFSNRTILPIDLNELVELIKRSGVVAQINFYEVAYSNPGILRGCLDRYKSDFVGEVADIYTPKDW